MIELTDSFDTFVDDFISFTYLFETVGVQAKKEE